MAKIIYPKNFENKVALFKQILDKHREDGSNSPLGEYDLDVLERMADSALDNHHESKRLARLSEEHTAKRNEEFEQVEKSIRRIANFLKAKHPENPKHLVEWGFEVDDSARKRRERAAAQRAEV